ncbi:type VI secretion system protein ImpJ [Singulisphaera sp. GP187]|uniref:type VI secretion system baseplate subunit TssK n=1 Tax=Singulisphaera sp. GP187 TaxID=1882752 RepID=UPI00092BC0E4|nr:type VI secretion system baseplate subunit TssK [Singulisphaera sp. GP187]SIO60635.1 type VI secretion system protein ImpJ [Singulisphaera sp. GP187]
MGINPVHWHEGMFLRPHHFQLTRAHQSEQSHLNEKWDHHHNWGLREIDLDLDALANSRLVVRTLKARLRDGTQVVIPDDGVVPPVDLKPALQRSESVTVYLGVPVLQQGRANVAGKDSSDGVRYLVSTQTLPDENTGVNPQPISVRRLNLKLLLSDQDQTGYEVLPIARVMRSPRAEATPQLDLTYIPPLLACDAWQPLCGGILQSVYDRIGQKIDLLANQVVSRGITFDSQTQGDLQIFAQLRELDQAYPVLAVVAFVDGVHPLAAYLELCRLVGHLAIFDPTRRPPELPRYDHDDLGRCFYGVRQQIDALLDILVEPEYKEQPFVGAGLRMEVTLEPAWLESSRQMFIGVRCSLDPEECIRLLTKPGQLDMKVGSSDRVDGIFRFGQAGLQFTHTPRPPRALPALPNLIYFQINRDSEPLEWQNVQKSLTLAIRLNENLVAGNIQGQRTLMIKADGQSTTLQFTLYVVAKTR